MNIPSWLAGRRILCPKCPDKPITLGFAGGDKKADLANEFVFHCPFCGATLRLRKGELMKAAERRKLAEKFEMIGSSSSSALKNFFKDLSNLMDSDLFGAKKKK